MDSQFLTKLVVALLVPCLILYAVGCYTYEVVQLKDADIEEDVIVGTKAGTYVWLRPWTADSLGNITGRGVEHTSLWHARHRDAWWSGHDHWDYEGVVPADSIAFVEAKQLNTVGTVFVVALYTMVVVFTVALIWLAWTAEEE